MEIISGMIKKVLTDAQFDMIKKQEIDPKQISIFDTLRVSESKMGDPIEYLLFRVSYKEVDTKGREKFIYDEEDKEYKVLYSRSPVIYAYGKQMRILLQMGENVPIKIAYEKISAGEAQYYRVSCIQDQRSGKL